MNRYIALFFLIVFCSATKSENHYFDREKYLEYEVDSKVGSIYSDLMEKIGDNHLLYPVISYFTDNLLETYMDTINCRDCIKDEPFFRDPLEYIYMEHLSNDHVLVAMKLIVSRQTCYFLIRGNDIKDLMEISDHRSTVLKRELRDWNNDDFPEFIEYREHGGQLYSSSKEYVYEIKDCRFNLISCLEYDIVDCRFSPE